MERSFNDLLQWRYDGVIYKDINDLTFQREN